MADLDAELTDYSEDGVDLTLIRWFQSLTPLERLQYVENQINDILLIRKLNGIETTYDWEQPSSDPPEAL